ncbi:type IV toxin-antitoxin system AbiEi family antitoxin domain-containing protein [uncultured Jatrophihabitans sp.]|uniref:type IV toxin-antitoxin system AbiEi family antitoxin domain-containing protein n=1 Tax=uncultured Jatrophihabitans sp. TaxID=1610747 RepID=UPI0035CB5BB2
MRALPSAPGQFGVVTARQAYAAGWTSAALRHAVAVGTLRRLRAGVYAVPAPRTGDAAVDAASDLRQAAVAVAIAHRRSTLTAASALVVYGVPLLDPSPQPCVTFARRFRGHIDGAHLHRARLWTGQIRRLGPVLLTTPERSLADLARERGVDAGVVSADAGLRLGVCSSADLDAAVQDCRGWPFARRAAEALTAAHPGAESALESLSRLRITRAGLPAPRTQVEIRVSDRFVGRVDFYWDEPGVVGEADGRGKYTDPQVLYDEKRRQERLEAAGLIVVRWGWAELADFTTTAARLRSALARGTGRPADLRGWTTTCHPRVVAS